MRLIRGDGTYRPSPVRRKTIPKDGGGERQLGIPNVVHDGRVLQLIGRYLRAGVMVDGVLQPTDEGAPQGGPLSPLLSNILLDDFDKELERRQLKFVRYADDFVIFVRRDPRTKLRSLLRLGVEQDLAIKQAFSRKGYWRLSQTPAMRNAMPNSWLEQQGLLSLKQLWCDLAPLRGTPVCQ